MKTLREAVRRLDPARQVTASFDLHDKRLFDQLDTEELSVVSEIAKAVAEWSKNPK